MNTTVNKGPVSSVTTPGLASVKTISDLNAKIEELQQESVRVKTQKSSRDTYLERCFLAHKREINTLTRKGCVSCKASGHGDDQTHLPSSSLLHSEEPGILQCRQTGDPPVILRDPRAEGKW